MKSASAILFAVSYILPGMLFHACVDRLPPESSQAQPGWVSRRTDQLWHDLSLRWVTSVVTQREEVRKTLHSEKRRLKITSDLFEPEESETSLVGTYGQLPEIHVDHNEGFVFPTPLEKPHRFSWYQAGILSRQILHQIKRLQSKMDQWHFRDDPNKIKDFDRIAYLWNDINKNYVSLSQQVRYLESWVPQLENLWVQEASQGRKPASHTVIQSLFSKDERLLDTLREILKPHRVMKRSFLPDQLEETSGIITLPIATDIRDKKFLAEIEGALNTHWNQSAWAKGENITFHIEWTLKAPNRVFASGKESLSEHLDRFPKDHAIITTGGLTTYVRRNALVLGPGKIHPRTLAHELGHLMGFGDCYLRTLTSQGFFGLGVLEWDNPFYPDDLMCDNSAGEPRVEVW